MYFSSPLALDLVYLLSPEVPRFQPGRTYLITSGETTTNVAVSRSWMATLQELRVSSNPFPYGLGRHCHSAILFLTAGEKEREVKEKGMWRPRMWQGMCCQPVELGLMSGCSLHTLGSSVIRLPSETGHHPGSLSHHQILRTVTLSPEEQETGGTHPEGLTAQTHTPEREETRPDL